jgi:hypothetical protein
MDTKLDEVAAHLQDLILDVRGLSAAVHLSDEATADLATVEHDLVAIRASIEMLMLTTADH